MTQLSDSELNRLKQILNEPQTKLKDPVKQMIEDGFGVVTPAGTRALLLIRERYVGDFKDFFTVLVKRYDKNKRATAEIKRLSGVLSKINSVANLIDKILMTSDPFVARDSGLELRESLADIDNELVFFSDVTKITGTLSRGFEETAAKFKDRINLEGIKKAQAVFSKKSKEITAQPSIGKTMLGWGKSLGKTALTVATLDMMGTGEFIRGSIAKRAEKKQRLESRELESAGTNVRQEATQSSVGEVIKGRRGRSTKEAADEDRLGRSRRAKYDTTSSISGGLYSFFNRDAMDAEWTKRLLVAVEGTGPIEIGGGRGKRWDLIGEIIGAAVVGAMLGWLAGKTIGKIVVNGQTVDVHTENAWRWLMGKTDKQIDRKQRADAAATGNPEIYWATFLKQKHPNWSSEKIQQKAFANVEWARANVAGENVNPNYNFEGDEDLAVMATGEAERMGISYGGERTGIPSEIYKNGPYGYETVVDGTQIAGKSEKEVMEKVAQFNESQGISVDWREKMNSQGDTVPIDTSEVDFQKETKETFKKISDTLTDTNEAKNNKTPISV